MADTVAAEWASILAANGYPDFEALWNADLTWFEPPNRRRGGWSGVAACALRHPGGGVVEVFVKRQQDHCRRSLVHGLRRVPTYQLELENIRRYQRCGVPTLEVAYFGRRQRRAILVTRALVGHISLEALIERWRRGGWPPADQRRRVIRQVAALLSRMHACRLQHNSFYPKHVFIPDDAAGTARVIDLESSRRRRLGRGFTLRDLDSLNRYSPAWSTTDRLAFLKAYLGIARLTPRARRMWRTLARRAGGRRGG